MCCSLYQIIIKIKCAKILKKPNGCREIKKKYYRKNTKIYPKMASRKGGLAVKNCFSAVRVRYKKLLYKLLWEGLTTLNI